MLIPGSPNHNTNKIQRTKARTESSLSAMKRAGAVQPKQPAAIRNFSKPVMSTTKYDTTTGQVYKETEVRVAKSQHSDWIGEFKTPSLVKRPSSNEVQGARSLFDMAKIRAARQIRDVRPQHLEDVPWDIAERIWDEIIEIRGESLHAWRLFAQQYPSITAFGDSKRRYQITIKAPSLPLVDYFKGINSPRVQWLTTLRISPKETTTQDLISIAQIKNLAVLDLSDGQAATVANPAPSRFDERVMRTWAELASAPATKGEHTTAFQHLRVLLLGWQEFPSIWIFKYLDQFPSLRQVIVTDCANIHQRNRDSWQDVARNQGWEARHGKRSAKSLKPVLDDRGWCFGGVSGCWYHSFGSDTDEKEKRLPMLECWIGTPKIWSHVVDEFPSTRTVWFDKTSTNGDENVPQKEQAKTAQEANLDPETMASIKRTRDVNTTAKELRSPPPKRPGGSANGRAVRVNKKSAADLLKEMGY